MKSTRFVPRSGIVGAACLVTLACLVLACGCAKEPERPKFDAYAQLSDARGLAPQQPVRWRGVDVGHVVSVVPEGNAVRAEFLLNAEHKSVLRDDLRARASRGLLSNNPPVLELYGGDPARPVLPPQARIPEALIYETFPKGGLYLCGGIVVLLLIATFLVRRIKRLLVFALACLLLAGSVWFVKRQWDKHRHEFVSADLEAEVSRWADRLLKSPEATAAWETVRRDVGDAWDKLRQESAGAASGAREEVLSAVDRQIHELQAKGQEAVVPELEGLKRKMLETLRGTAPATHEK